MLQYPGHDKFANIQFPCKNLADCNFDDFLYVFDYLTSLIRSNYIVAVIVLVQRKQKGHDFRHDLSDDGNTVATCRAFDTFDINYPRCLLGRGPG